LQTEIENEDLHNRNDDQIGGDITRLAPQGAFFMQQSEGFLPVCPLFQPVCVSIFFLFNAESTFVPLKFKPELNRQKT
jgi:hypothetical protein